MTNSVVRLIATALVVLAAGSYLMRHGYQGWGDRGGISFVLFLLLIFFIPERISDERVRQLKLRALTAAFCFGYAVVATAGIVLRYNVRRPDPDLPLSLSAVDFMFVVLVMAIGLFHFWRFEDGRAGRGPPRASFRP